MREILFRGKPTRLKRFKWVHGQLLHHSEKLSNIYSVEIDHPSTVIPETVGQFTGLTDTNGVKIFEGDIVHVHDCLLKPSAPYHEFDGVIEHKNGSFVIVGELITHYRWLDYDVTVLGNIHDNPELLEAAYGE